MIKTVFISSTFEDFKEIRKKVWDKLNTYEVNIRGMEKFGARPTAPLQTCLAEVEQSDIFVCIIGYRLGSIDPASSKSFVQLEYEKALELRKEIFIYFLDDKAGKVNVEFVDFGENHEKLEAFKSILKERHTIDYFTDDTDLIEKLGRKFKELLEKNPEKKNENEDDYKKSSDILDNFLLLPKSYSGKEVKLKIKFTGKPFPASKAICKSFYLSYGSTIGIGIKLINPNITEEAFNYLFINGKHAEELFAIKRDEEIEIYASPMFTDDTIESIKANFVTSTTIRYSNGNNVFSPVSPYYIPNKPFETEVIPAEGQIILQLKDFVRK